MSPVRSVRASMVPHPADCRWSSSGEAIGGGKKGNGKKCRDGARRMNGSGKPAAGVLWSLWSLRDLQVRVGVRLVVNVSRAARRRAFKGDTFQGSDFIAASLPDLPSGSQTIVQCKVA